MTNFKLKGDGDFDMEVVGESHYQKNFEFICGPRSKNGEERKVEAALVPDPKNLFDPNAVRVEVQGRIVGHLSREIAKNFRELLHKFGIPADTILLVDAEIRGGWKRSDDDEGNYGIRLDMPMGSQAVEQLKEIAKRSATEIGLGKTQPTRAK